MSEMKRNLEGLILNLETIISEYDSSILQNPIMATGNDVSTLAIIIGTDLELLRTRLHTILHPNIT